MSASMLMDPPIDYNTYILGIRHLYFSGSWCFQLLQQVQE